MPPKIALTDAQKLEFCRFADENKMTRSKYVEWIESKWSVKVHESTITRILQTKEKRLTAEIDNPNKRRNRSVTIPRFELALKEFILTYQHRTVLSEAMLIEKARQLSKGLGIPEGTLQFSSGWLYKFKKRNGIHKEKLHGEAGSVDNTVIINSFPLLQEKCAEYPLDRIYNMDETALFYRLEPDYSLATERLTGRKKNKERISIALCANADGSHKLNPLVIGKYAKPRCFKNVKISNLPILYRNNTKAWMLITLFQEWLHWFNLQVATKHSGQRVLLILDNCSSHKVDSLDLPNIEILFLPPHTTSKIQPMDAGIIMAFKRNYRHFHIQWMLEEVESGKKADDLKMDILRGIRYVIKAWNEVKERTIYNCWLHTNILSNNNNIISSESSQEIEETDELLNLSDSIENLNLPNFMKVDDFLAIPEEDIVCEIPDESSIMAEIIEIFNEGPEESDHEDSDEADDSVETAIISTSEALKSLEVMRAFLLQQEDSGEYIKKIESIEKFVNAKRVGLMKQTNLKQYFNL